MKRKAELKPALETFIQNEAPAIVAETRRRARGKDGKFDGLLGGLPEGAATLIESLLTLHRDYLLLVFESDPDGEAEIRTLIREHANTSPSFKAVPAIARLPLKHRDAVRLAIHTIGAIAEALPQEDDERDVAYIWTRIAGTTVGTAVAKVEEGRRQGAQKAGAVTKAKADEEWRNRCTEVIRSMLLGGTPRKDIAGKLAARFGKSSRSISPLVAIVEKEIRK